jgi:chromosome segregation ATPase
MEHSRALEKLSILEERITQTTNRLSLLKDQYRAIQGQKELLEKELDELRTANSVLTGRINDLKLIHEEHANSFDKEEVRKKIDRMLEKFGELQL